MKAEGRMLRAVIVKPGEVRIEEVAKPTLKEGEVLIEIRNVGICGSDIHVFHGEHIYKTYPVIPGHEFSGEVVETGEGVDKIKTGEKVTVRPQISCGHCYCCRHGNYHICDNLKVIGFHIPGGSSEYLAAPVENVIPLPEKLSFEEGAMVEPAAVAVHALKKCGEIKGRKVLVLGAGPIGNLVAQTAKALGAVSTMITDKSEFRLQLASDCAVDYCVDVVNRDLEKELLDKFGSDKADVILECVGIEETVEQAIELARKGTDIIIVGVPGKKLSLEMGLVQENELRLIGTLMYKEEDFYDAVRLVSEDKIELKKLITDKFPLTEYAEAFRYIDEKEGEVVKVEIYLK